RLRLDAFFNEAIELARSHDKPVLADDGGGDTSLPGQANHLTAGQPRRTHHLLDRDVFHAASPSTSSSKRSRHLGPYRRMAASTIKSWMTRLKLLCPASRASSSAARKTSGWALMFRRSAVRLFVLMRRPFQGESRPTGRPLRRLFRYRFAIVLSSDSGREASCGYVPHVR